VILWLRKLSLAQAGLEVNMEKELEKKLNLLYGQRKKDTHVRHVVA